MVDGTVVADDWADLISGTINNKIDKTETGAAPPVPFAWTGTEPNGVVVAGGTDSCSLWSDSGVASGRLGDTTKSDGEWTSAGALNCDQELVVYCFQQQ